MAYYNGIWSLVPEECTARVDPNSASQEGSAEFLIGRWTEYVKSLLPSMAAGIALGSISAAGFLLFVVWAVVRSRRKTMAARLAKQDAKLAREAAAGSMNGGEEAAEEGPPSPQPITSEQGAGSKAGQDVMGEGQHWWQRLWRALTADGVLRWAIVVIALATIGVAAWGLATSVIATQGLVDSFWLLIDRAREIVLDLSGAISSLGENLGEVAGTLNTVQDALEKIVDTVANIPVVGGLIGRALPMDKIEELVGPTAENAINSMTEASVTINNTVVPILNDKVLPALDNVLQNEGWTTELLDTWWYIVIAVLFGLLILISAAVAYICFSMHQGVAATALVATLWGVNALVMFVGLGMLQGARSVANDACLYSEDFVSGLVEAKLDGPAGELAGNALDYYFGRANLTDSNGNPLLTNGTTECNAELTAALLKQVAGIELSEALVFAWKAAELLPSISGLLGGINLPTIPLVNFDLNSVLDPVLVASDQMQDLLADVCNVTLLLIRENAIWPLYVDTKTYVCCDLTDALYNVWLPWTVVGALALALSLLASLRIVTSTLAPPKRRGNTAPSSVQLAEVNGKGSGTGHEAAMDHHAQAAVAEES